MINFTPFRIFRGPLFHKRVTGQELFFALYFSKPALLTYMLHHVHTKYIRLPIFCLKWNHFTIYRAIIRTQWNFTSMTAINAKTFGKSVWNTIPFFGAPQAWRVRGKSTDFWVEAPRFGKNFYNTSFEFSFNPMVVSLRNVQKCFCIFWIDQEFVFFKTNKNSYNFYQFDGLIVSDQNIRGDEKMIFKKNK